MQVQMHDGAVPFVITYRKIVEKPKLERRRKFVGPLQLLKNAALRAVEMFEEMAYETTTDVIDPGKSVAVHWAVQVEDPWDTAPGRSMNLVATRMLNDMPPCGAHFEILSPPKAPRNQLNEDVYFDEALEESTGGHQVETGAWIRPADPAYGAGGVGDYDESRDDLTGEEEDDIGGSLSVV